MFTGHVANKKTKSDCVEKAVTIKDLAQKLGVAPSTVSRALKDHYSISPEMKRRVIALANEVNYSPNQLALSLRESRTHVIGVLMPEVVHYFFSTVLSGIEEAAAKRGYQVIMAQSNESYFREVANANALLSGRVDGLIASITKETENVDHFGTLVKKNVPLTFFDRTPPSLVTNRVVFDDFQGGYLATDHMLRTGCERVIHFGGPVALDISKKRREGYEKAMADHGKSDRVLVVPADDHDAGEQAVNQLIAQGEAFDGICSVNNDTAVGALRALKRLGKGVPQEVSLVGFGDGPLSEFADPPLTTVNQAGEEMGRTAAKILIDQIEATAPTPHKVEVIPAQLIVRQSTRSA